MTDRPTTWLRRNRHNGPLTVGLLFLLIMLTTGGNDPRLFDRTRSTAEVAADRAITLPVTATVGQSVRDGRFAFVVTSLQEPGTTLADRLGIRETAEGVFVIVWVNVSNIGYESASLAVTGQFLVDAEGQRFATSAASSSLVGSEKLFREKINPGGHLNDAPLLFDIPPGSTPAGIELHGSLASTGVMVSLADPAVSHRMLS